MSSNNVKQIDILKKGNSKLKNMLVYSHSPVKGCQDCSECASTCYALKSYRQYPSVKTAWDRNLDTVKNDLRLFKAKITVQLLRAKEKTVRIHASGDFISQEYIEAWAEIAEAFPEVNFYAYTKSLQRFDYSSLTSLSNVNIIDSYIDGKLNYGDAEHIADLVNNHGAFLCPATVDKSVKCGESCNYCVTENRVCFNQH